MPDWKQLAILHKLPLNEAELERAVTSLNNVWRIYEPLAKTLGPMDDSACPLHVQPDQERAQ